jgi:hypothetical protein
MSNWNALTIKDLLAAARSEFVLTAQSQSLSTGNDPVAEVIADITAYIRSAVSLYNSVDANTAAIPNSLRRTAAAVCNIELKKRIPFELSQADLDDQHFYRQRIRDVSKEAGGVESPDNSVGSGEMQEGGSDMDRVRSYNPYGARQTDGLLLGGGCREDYYG